MDLKRVGANRNFGYTAAFEDEVPTIEFLGESGGISFSVARADGMGAQGEYDYVVNLSSDDVAEMLIFLAEQQDISKSKSLCNALRRSSNAILRLLILSSGLPFLFQPTERERRVKGIKRKLDERRNGEN